MNWADIIGRADNLTAVLVAVLVLQPVARGAYTRSVGSRRHTAQLLRSLSCGNTEEFVTTLFGHALYVEEHITKAPQPQPSADTTVRWKLYNARHGWLTVHYIDNRVAGYAFVVTDPRFRFDLTDVTFGVMRGTLATTPFAAMNPDAADNGVWYNGAHSYGYTEGGYLGRPGQYHTFMVSRTIVGHTPDPDPQPDAPSLEWGAFAGAAEDAYQPAALDAFRRTAAPDCFAVYGDGYTPYDQATVGAAGCIHPDTMQRFTAASGPRGWRRQPRTATTSIRWLAARPRRHR